MFPFPSNYGKGLHVSPPWLELYATPCMDRMRSAHIPKWPELQATPPMDRFSRFCKASNLILCHLRAWTSDFHPMHRGFQGYNMYLPPWPELHATPQMDRISDIYLPLWPELQGTPPMERLSSVYLTELQSYPWVGSADICPFRSTRSLLPSGLRHLLESMGTVWDDNPL